VSIGMLLVHTLPLTTL